MAPGWRPLKWKQALTRVGEMKKILGVGRLGLNLICSDFFFLFKGDLNQIKKMFIFVKYG